MSRGKIFLIIGALLSLGVVGTVVFVLRERALPTNEALPPVSVTGTSAGTATSTPQASDSDHDGLSDAEEAAIGTNPNKWDTDGDGSSDSEEVRITKHDPLKPDLLEDSPRRRATIIATSTLQGMGAGSTVAPPEAAPPPPADSDADGLTDDQENQLDTDPNKPDTDADGLTDGDEVNKYKTDPLKRDTDGDTYPDGTEVERGYNPLGPGTCAVPACIP